MRKVYLLFVLLSIFVVYRSEAQVYGFTRMALDKNNSVILYSSFQDEIKFNDTIVRADYWFDVKHFIAKCDSDMNLVWFRYLGYWDWNKPLAVELVSDGAGNTYMACLLNSSFALNDSVVAYVEGWLDSARIVLAKYDPYGQLVWHKRSSLVGLTKSKMGLGLDSNDNLYLSYNFFPRFTFGGDTASESLTSSGTFVIKIDSVGNEQWLTSLSGSKQNNDFCVSPKGATCIAGTASSLQGFGPITFTIPDGPAPSLSVCKSSGSPYWQANLMGRLNEHTAVGVGPNERPVVVGKFYDTIGFTSLPTFSVFDSAFFVANYNSDGTERWAKKVDGIDLTDVGVTSSNDIFLLGEMTKSTVVIETTTLSMSGAEGAVVRLDSSGNYLCNFKFSNFFVESSAVGPADEFHICGRADFRQYSYSGFWRPVFGGDSMYSASDACIYVVTIGANCEIIDIDSLGNWYHYENVADYTAKSRLVIYPNPVSSKLNVQIHTPLPSDGKITVRNQEGKVLHSQAVKSQNEQVDVDSLPPGLYILEYLTGTETIVEKFVKR